MDLNVDFLKLSIWLLSKAPAEVKWEFILRHLLVIVDSAVRLALISCSSDVRKLWAPITAKAFNYSTRKAQRNFCQDAVQFTKTMRRFPSLQFTSISIFKIYLPTSQLQIDKLANAFSCMNIHDLTVICGHNHNFMADALRIWSRHLCRLSILRLEFDCSRENWEDLSPFNYEEVVSPLRIRPHPPYPWSMSAWHTTLSKLTQLQVLVLHTPLMLSDDLGSQNCPSSLESMVGKWASEAPFLKRIYLLYAGDEWYGDDFQVDGNMGFFYRLTKAHPNNWEAEDIQWCLDFEPSTEQFKSGVLPGDESSFFDSFP